MAAPPTTLRNLMDNVDVISVMYPFRATLAVPPTFSPHATVNVASTEFGTAEDGYTWAHRPDVVDISAHTTTAADVDHTLAATTATFPRHGLFMSSPSPTPSDGPGTSTGLPLPAAYQDEPSPLLSPLTTPARCTGVTPPRAA